MAAITTIFSDVGGVLATNGWDIGSRQKAAGQFHLDWTEFEERHQLVATAFEIGHLNLNEYLDRTVFHQPRPFTQESFRDFMFAQSQPFPDSLALFEQLAASKKYFMATINNESLELNLHRIEQLGLRSIFSVFFSSCFLGLKKPDQKIYQLALKLTARPHGDCLFIDDRRLNVEIACRCGMQTIHYENVPQLKGRMKELGVET